MTALEDELKARERSAQPHREPPPARENNCPTNLFVIGGTPTNTCCYCRQNHQRHLCQLVLDPETRKQSLRRSGRCFNCLTRGHLGRDCRSKLRCATCVGRHHLSICDKTGQHAIPKNKDTGARTDKNVHLLSCSTPVHLLSTLNTLPPRFVLAVLKSYFSRQLRLSYRTLKQQKSLRSACF